MWENDCVATAFTFRASLKARRKTLVLSNGDTLLRAAHTIERKNL